jgi:hypothetical protein
MAEDNAPGIYANTTAHLIPAAQVRAASSLKVMAYKVTLKTPSGEQVIECADDVYILDAAEEAGELVAGRGPHAAPGSPAAGGAMGSPNSLSK